MVVANLSMKAAVGYAIPIPPQNPIYHCVPVPDGYAVVGVDEVVSGFQPMKLDYPAGEGNVDELGDATKLTVLWRKKYIVLPN